MPMRFCMQLPMPYWGAAGLGDIGSHFPDTTAEFKDADSRVLLREAYQSVQALGWKVVNVDTTVIAQKPKTCATYSGHARQYCRRFGLSENCVNIKGKTNEKLGYLGRMEAIEAQATVLLIKA